MVGKYVRSGRCLQSLKRGAVHAGLQYRDTGSRSVYTCEIRGRWRARARAVLQGADAILVPGRVSANAGPPIEGKIAAAEVMRAKADPLIWGLGICLGMQARRIEFARNVAGLADRATAPSSLPIRRIR